MFVGQETKSQASSIETIFSQRQATACEDNGVIVVRGARARVYVTCGNCLGQISFLGLLLDICLPSPLMPAFWLGVYTRTEDKFL